VTAVELSPDERKRIYEEEKARIEAEARQARGSGELVYDTSTRLAPNVAGLLCYLGWWVTGLIFFILEQKNQWVRFHAAQSLVFFGAITVASSIVRLIPLVGVILGTIIWLIGVVFWIVMMVKAYQGEHYMLPVAGEIADRMVGPAPEYHYTSNAARAPSPTTPPPAPEVMEAGAPPARAATDEGVHRRAKTYRRERREARIAGSAVAIAWFIILFLFFNFFYQYAAYYSAETVNGAVIWTRNSFFTGEISRWQPILNVTLALAIIGHFCLMFLEHRLLRQTIRIGMDALGLATVVTLLSIYPFDFSVIPDSTAAAATQVSVTVVLIVIAVAFAIGLIVRIIKLLIGAARTLARPQQD
jgi:uncharacterized membrane protein